MKDNLFTISASNKKPSNCTDNLKALNILVSKSEKTLKSHTDTVKAHRELIVIHKGMQYWKFPVVDVEDHCSSKVNHSDEE